MLLRADYGKWIWLIAVVLFTAATYSLLERHERFYVVDEQILQDPSFIRGDLFWENADSIAVKYNAHRMEIHHPTTATVRISQSISPLVPAYYRFSVHATGKRILGHKIGAGGIAHIATFNDVGDRINYSRLVFQKGTFTPARYEETRFLDARVRRLELTFGLFSSSGKFSVWNPRVERLAEFPPYVKTRQVLTLVWVLIAILSSTFLLMLISTVKVALIVGTLTIGCFAVFLPGGTMMVFGEYLFGFFPNVSNNGFGIPLIGGGEARAFSHVLVFMCVACAVAGLSTEFGLQFCLVVTLWFACASEVIQMLILGRSPEMIDIMFNLIGAAIGLYVAKTWLTRVVIPASDRNRKLKTDK